MQQKSRRVHNPTSSNTIAPPYIPHHIPPTIPYQFITEKLVKLVGKSITTSRPPKVLHGLLLLLSCLPWVVVNIEDVTTWLPAAIRLCLFCFRFFDLRHETDLISYSTGAYKYSGNMFHVSQRTPCRIMEEEPNVIISIIFKVPMGVGFIVF